FAYYHRDAFFRRGTQLEIVCIEQNPDYVTVGKKVLPEATWICANVLDLPASLGRFDCAIANPPFGRIKSTGAAPRYTGAEFEYSVSRLAAPCMTVFRKPTISLIGIGPCAHSTLDGRAG